MKKFFAITLAVIISGVIVTATAKNPHPAAEKFHSIVSILLIPEIDQGTNAPEWIAIENIKGVNWKWPLNEMAQHSFEMTGTLGDDIKVEFKGSRTHISSVAMLMPADIDVFNADELKERYSDCGEEHATMKFYLWTKPGNTPLHLIQDKEFSEKALYVISNENPIGNIFHEIIYAYGCEVGPVP